jgi:hypothetical protein
MGLGEIKGRTGPKQVLQLASGPEPYPPKQRFFSKIALKLKKSKKSVSFQIITKIIPVERARSCPLNGWQAMPPLG